MKAKNKYILRAKISESKFRQLIKLFAHDLDAQTIASLAHLNRNTVNRYLTLTRERIAAFSESRSPFEGRHEWDSVLADVKPIAGKRGRNLNKKAHIFGILKRENNVYTEIVPNPANGMLQGVIHGRIDPASIICSDGWRGYDGLVDFGRKKLYRVDNGHDKIVGSRPNINAVESFWAYTKRRLMKFYGIADSTFYLHLKESEFRFNNRKEDIYPFLLRLFREKSFSQQYSVAREMAAA
jgi:transposase